MKFTLIFVAAALFAASAFGQDGYERSLLDTEKHIATVTKKGSVVVFRMEAVKDFTEDRDSSKPMGFGWDSVGIRIDINNNNVVDKNVDVAFGVRQKTNIFCPQYLIQENASTGCGGYRSKGKLLADFVSTPLQSVPHPVFIFEIPLAELDHAGGTIGLTFTFSDPSTDRFSYPNSRNRRSFDETIKLNLADL